MNKFPFITHKPILLETCLNNCGCEFFVGVICN